MRTVRGGLAVGLMAQGTVLAGLGTTVGLSGPAWAVGSACGVVTNLAMARGLVRYSHALGPADLVTLIRSSLTCGVAALVADALLHDRDVTALVAVSVGALALDAVDGRVARRTRTSPFGARYDGEVDAFLILVLSVYVARSFGGWVLAIGAARYVFGAAGLGLPWLRAQLPPRHWRKVVAATQGIVLVVASADLVPDSLMFPALVAALAMLAESFGRDVLWLLQQRRADRGTVETDDPPVEPVQPVHPARP